MGQSKHGIQVRFYEDEVVDKYSFKEAEQDLWLVEHDAFVLQHYITQTGDETLTEICQRLGANANTMTAVNQRRYKNLSSNFRQYKRTLKFAKHTSLLVPVDIQSAPTRWDWNRLSIDPAFTAVSRL